MPLSGRGMLITIMDADPAEEADFNRWYDREHIIERTAIPGFLESPARTARRRGAAAGWVVAGGGGGAACAARGRRGDLPPPRHRRTRGGARQRGRPAI